MPHSLYLETSEVTTLLDALDFYGPSRLGNHDLFRHLRDKLNTFNPNDPGWCYSCDRPKNDCVCRHV